MVPRIWEGEGSWRSEILNPVNNDYWVRVLCQVMAENAEYNQQVQEGIELDELLHGIVANLDSDSDGSI